MRVIDCKQGTPEWVHARLGIPTASCADQIITPKTRKPSGSQGRYAARLIGEWFLGRPLDESASDWMARGSEMEAEAVAWYEWENGVDTKPVGLCLRDDMDFGASPDRLVGDDGLLEIKCPSAERHMMYLLDHDELTDEYRAQVQAELWVTGRAWADLVSYNPVLPKVCVRVVPDPAFHAALAAEVPVFNAKIAEYRARLEGKRAEAMEAQRLAEASAENEHPF